MTNLSLPITQREAEISPRAIALIAGLSLLGMAVLAPFAVFGVLDSIVVHGDATATVNNLIASEGLFRLGIAAFLVVIMLDLVVAWALYVLFRPTHQAISLLTGWLRVAFAAIFAGALASLMDVAQLVGSPGVDEGQVAEQVTSSLASFDNGWTAIALPIFGLHLLGLGYLVYRSAFFPRFLGVLVAIAGAGYLIDGFGMILVPDYIWTVGLFAFVGEALLILALLWRAVRGFPFPSAPEAEARLPSPGPAPS